MGKAISKAVKWSTFGKVDLDPRTPKLPKPQTAPDPETTAKLQERALQRRRRSGRTSTVLTGESNLG